MKRIGLSRALPFVLPFLALVLGVASPSTASAEGWRGGGHAAAHAVHASGGWSGAPVSGGGWRGGSGSAPVAGGGWRGGSGARPVPHFAPSPRVSGGHPIYGGHAVAGRWGWHGPNRVWIGVPTARPYAGWLWTPGQWTWDGYQWTWQDGFWSPPY